MDPDTLATLNHLALSDDVPPGQVMEMARHVDCTAMAAQHNQIQGRWLVRILVAGVLDVAQNMEGIEAVVLDFTTVGTGWSLKDSMQVIVAPGHDAKKVAKKFEKQTGPIRSRLGFSREVYQSIALQFSYGKLEMHPAEEDLWSRLAASGERITAKNMATIRRDIMDQKTAVAGGHKTALRL